ncbi:MAG: 3-oxoacyl-ACP synthase [Bacteroidetes bacterium]|nr:MAG: 3-oxoacyl-ACP synthase [Bacteroidota bacterium]
MSQSITAYSQIRSSCIKVNGSIEYCDENFITFAEFIKPFFKHLNLGYPKFYKMDPLSKLGFIAAELVFRKINIALYDRNRVGIVLANASSSLDTDLAHQRTIDNRSQYFPSPSVFVYTLPNIMIGEICIRHQLKGENGFLISEKFDSLLLFNYVNELFQHHRVDACLTGWVDLLQERFEALLLFVEPTTKAPAEEPLKVSIPFSAEAMDTLYKIT